ncbi:hypothetical protein OF83DRAFT_1094875 [Amylostereum chailletii]|nr:hypothetical protein OF83DRAFT_1094875 [Amylostereum chailletii]
MSFSVTSHLSRQKRVSRDSGEKNCVCRGAENVLGCYICGTHNDDTQHQAVHL